MPQAGGGGGVLVRCNTDFFLLQVLEDTLSSFNEVE